MTQFPYNLSFLTNIKMKEFLNGNLTSRDKFEFTQIIQVYIEDSFKIPEIIVNYLLDDPTS